MRLTDESFCVCAQAMSRGNAVRSWLGMCIFAPESARSVMRKSSVADLVRAAVPVSVQQSSRVRAVC